MNVLTVDYQSPDAPAQFCKSLRETGFAVLRNHPISPDLINQGYEQWRKFFSSEEKMQYLYQKPSQAGYFPFRTESAKGSAIGDLKEFYHFYQAGPQPAEAAAISTSLFNELNTMATTLLQWVENHLPIDVANNLSMPLKRMIVDSPNTMLRILHYPPLQGDIEPGAERASAHEDINVLTLLPAATTPGLEVKDVRGNWHAVTCDPGNIVVNVGDTLQEATAQYFKSTTHRVVNPDVSEQHTSRYSMPMFLHARPEVRISERHTAETYLHERLRELGIY